MKKPTFLERLTGADTGHQFDDALGDENAFEDENIVENELYDEQEEWQEDDSQAHAPQEGELPVDMYQTDDTIVIRALVAGVNPSDLDIAITRDMVTIRGMREEYQESADDQYYHRELFWGSFSRTLLLPEEVVIDEAHAEEKHGLLEIRLMKLDKHRSTQLKVKTNAQQK